MKPFEFRCDGSSCEKGGWGSGFVRQDQRQDGERCEG